jgi:hypothetical protein
MELIPNDVLKITFEFVDNIKDSLSLLLVSKTWNTLVRLQDEKWERLSLEFWNSIEEESRKRFSDQQFDHIDIRLMQKESNRSWLW